MEQLARIPTRGDLAKTALGIIPCTAVFTTLFVDRVALTRALTIKQAPSGIKCLCQSGIWKIAFCARIFTRLRIGSIRWKRSFLVSRHNAI